MTDPSPTSGTDLRTRILALIRDNPDAGFPDLALDIFRYQHRHNSVYRAYCERQGIAPDTVADWREIPAVPTDAFKAAPLVCGDPVDAAIAFRTSGTTRGRGRRGSHYVPDLALYHAALRAGFRRHLLPDRQRMRILSLIPGPDALPDSSLSHMVGEVMDEYGKAGSGVFADTGGVDHHRLASALRDAEAATEPICLLGTAFGLVNALDGMREMDLRVPLPDGSRLMDTGGFKGRTREVSREMLYARIAERLHIPSAWCVNEYGMTELGSQFYDAVAGDGASPAERLHHHPPWMRSRVMDAETLGPLPDGEVGVLRHWDPVNLGSVMAIQTDDLAVAEGDGFRLLGRARGAEARGCSLAMEEILEAMNAG